MESSTLFYLLDYIQHDYKDTNRFYDGSSPKFSDELSAIFYRRLINEVVRIHRGHSEKGSSFAFKRSTHEASASEVAEAIEAFKAAKIHQANHRYQKSRKLLEHAFRLDPDNTDVLVALGEVLEGSWRSLGDPLSFKNTNSLSNSLIRLSDSASDTGRDDLVLAADQLYTRALIVNPHLESAGARKSRLMPLVEEIDQRRFNAIDSKVRRFYQIPDTDPGLRRAKIEQYFKHIYHSNAIEGNTLTLAQTRSILETRLAVGGKSLMEQNEVLGLDAALRYLNSTLLRGHHSTITLPTILELHRHVLSFVDPTEAGNLRRTEVFVADHKPPPPESVPELMNELVTWLNADQLSDVHPIELAALTHWKLVYIHPFYDGNGRTARLLMNLILMRAGLPPAIIQLEDRHAYYEHLKSANEGDVRPFIRFIASCTERTIDEYLRAAEPQQIKPDIQQLPVERSTITSAPSVLSGPNSLSWSAWPFALSPVDTNTRVIIQTDAEPRQTDYDGLKHHTHPSEPTEPVKLPEVFYLDGR